MVTRYVYRHHRHHHYGLVSTYKNENSVGYTRPIKGSVTVIKNQ